MHCCACLHNNACKTATLSKATACNMRISESAVLLSCASWTRGHSSCVPNIIKPWLKLHMLYFTVPQTHCIGVNRSNGLTDPAQELEETAGVGGRKDILPVKNLSNEMGPTTELSALMCKALEQCLFAAEDYITEYGSTLISELSD